MSDRSLSGLLVCFVFASPTSRLPVYTKTCSSMSRSSSRCKEEQLHLNSGKFVLKFNFHHSKFHFCGENDHRNDEIFRGNDPTVPDKFSKVWIFSRYFLIKANIGLILLNTTCRGKLCFPIVISKCQKIIKFEIGLI